MEAKTKDLWVFVETDESGNARNVGIELLSPGRKIADRQQGRRLRHFQQLLVEEPRVDDHTGISREPEEFRQRRRLQKRLAAADRDLLTPGAPELLRQRRRIALESA